jgi:hypothetical protein
MSNLLRFTNRCRFEPRLVAAIEAMPGAERGLQQIERFFQLLEARNDLAALKLKAEIEQIIDGDGTISARCFAVQRTISDALPAMIKSAGH